MRTRDADWLDTRFNKTKLGIDVFVNGKWVHCLDGDKVYFARTEKARQKKRKELRKIRMAREENL